MRTFIKHKCKRRPLSHYYCSRNSEMRLSFCNICLSNVSKVTTPQEQEKRIYLEAGFSAQLITFLWSYLLPRIIKHANLSAQVDESLGAFENFLVDKDNDKKKYHEIWQNRAAGPAFA